MNLIFIGIGIGICKLFDYYEKQQATHYYNHTNLKTIADPCCNYEPEQIELIELNGIPAVIDMTNDPDYNNTEDFENYYIYED